MAKRVKTIDEKGFVVDSDNQTLGKALEIIGRSDAPSVVVPEQSTIISRKDYDRTPLPNGVLVNLTHIEKGNLRDRLLDQETDLIARKFLARFPGKHRQISWADDDTYLLILNFPLPDGYHPAYIDLLIVTVSYPDWPPAGVHIPVESQNLKQIRDKLSGHVMAIEDLPESYKKRVEELESEQWRWVCYHYEDWQWKLNPNNLLAGDCLFKYVENLYAIL